MSIMKPSPTDNDHHPRPDKTGPTLHDGYYRVHRRISARVEHVIARLND
jgi:hypothetical protein